MDLITAPLAVMGYELVRVQMTGQSGNAVLQIMAEHENGSAKADGGMTVDDCAAISRAVSDLLDPTDIVPGEYSLEVSSPGIDRPLTRLKDYTRFCGYLAVVELTAPLEGALAGRKRFKGLVRDVKSSDRDAEVTFDVDGSDVTVSFGNIAKAKLVLTDELLKADMKKRDTAAKNQQTADAAE